MDLKMEIMALQKMTAGQLRQKHVELFQEPSRSSNRQWLFRRLAWRIQSLDEGNLSERARERARQLAREADIRLRPPRELKMPPATGYRINAGAIHLQHDKRLPMPGAVLSRKFKGQMYYVNVLTKGFEFDGELYRSLSAIAHKITGCHWNGYHFFNLKKRSNE
ncbi:MAG: hypothetical protein A2Y13_05310 [Planctomycetes bacterium GWC2_45_44]|nr:MAG: hypothetical protein A2Y13_05310 [Planctomycetes bacterium GWC2_45_44]